MLTHVAHFKLFMLQKKGKQDHTKMWLPVH